MVVFKLAWRNIWRSRTRSLVIMSAIVVGVAALIFLISFIRGQIQSYINNTIRHEISHIQIHHPDYKEDLEVQYIIDDIDGKLSQIEASLQVQAATARTIANGIISSPKSSRGVIIKGIVPEAEAAVTEMNTKIIEGAYLSDDKRNPIVIGSRLAEKLQVSIRKKIVLRFQNAEGDIIDAAFRIIGLYKTNKSQYDETNVFIRQRDLNELLGIENAAHEVAIYLKGEEALTNEISLVKTMVPNLLVESYEDISPDVRLFKSQIGISSAFLMFIVMMALFFGIVNTMLMAVLERYRELGMLMSVGMNKSKVFSMIILETLLIGIISAPIGMLLGYIAVTLTRRNGIDLSAYSDGMSQFGLSSVIYPVLDSSMYVQLASAVLFTSVIAALYPAYKAIKLRPVEAIRKI